MLLSRCGVAAKPRFSASRWQKVSSNRDVPCHSCGASLAPRAPAGLSSEPVFVFRDEFTSQLVWIARMWRQPSGSCWTDCAQMPDEFGHGGVLLCAPKHCCVCQPRKM